MRVNSGFKKALSKHIGSTGWSRGGHPRLDPGQPFFEFADGVGELLLLVRAESGVIDPPIHADLLGLVHGTNQQPNLNGQQLDVHDLHLDAHLPLAVKHWNV